MSNLLNTAYDREQWIDFLQNKFLPIDFKIKRQDINIKFKSRYIKPQAFWIGDCASLDDLAIIEISHDSEHDPRIGVSRDAFRLMAMHSISKALFFFVCPQSQNYRFSLITLDLKLKGSGVEYNFSNPKRFSFYLGSDAKTHTPESFIVKKERIRDFEDLQSRFSVEVVNKEFYQEIQRMFYQLVGGELSQGKQKLKYEPILKLPEHPDTKIRQEFGVRLIGRLVFCWFLKKKLSDEGNPLIPEAVLSTSAVKESYYHRVLEPLFFEMLNKRVEDRPPEIRNDTFDDIPYLNGGLFDPSQHQDYYSPSNSKRAAIVSWHLKIPDKWFKELFEILETYNFTIDENTSIDIDLCVDPEMLGRIFENLLAEINPETGQTAKNATGSFYTPRAIVEYMVDEALVQYLSSKTDIPEGLLRDLLDYSHEELDLSKAQKEAVLDALDQIKVLDPACGSGAFPIGILQKMLLILHRVDPESIEWVIRQLSKIPNKLVRDALEKKLMDENWQYKHKMGIIQNAIYGVDIQPVATEITKLRLFLTLIVDEKVLEDKPNKNIHPLPNLSFKFVTANSLISLSEERETLVRYKSFIERFDQIRDRYFHAHSTTDKEKIKVDFATLQRDISAAYLHPTYSQSSFLDEAEAKPLSTPKERAYILKLVKWNPFQDHVSEWFDPMWMFGIKEGFDIVIGNPPYIQLQKALDDKRKFADLYKECGFAGFERTGDIYCLFYERGKQLLCPDGHLCYITSNKWLRANYGKSLRQFLAEHTRPKILIDFGGFKVFDSATVDTNILIFQNSAPRAKQGMACSIKGDFYKGDSIAEYVAQQQIPLPPLSAESWIISDDAAQKLKAKIERVGTPLKDWDISIYRGILTGFNDAFIISGAKKDELIAADPRSAEIIKPILRGRDIKRYKAEFADLWLIATHNGYTDSQGNKIPLVNIDHYPVIKQHLDRYWEKVEKRADQGATPYNLRNCAYMEEFEKEKVVYQELTQGSSFTYAQIPKVFVSNTAYLITGTNLKYLVSILNSSFIEYAFKKYYSIGLGDNGIRWLNQYMQLLPIANPDDETKMSFNRTVDDIFGKRQNGENTRFIESQIDLMVYKLYELSYSEVKLIDPELDSVLASFGLSVQDYERMSIADLSKIKVS
jgi:adenine-specific DNA-methyltransferase